ncbi:hypothetical protein A6R68_06342 [Neotoma lepida]|uniref:Uncharacterized protein n=1 Tax=Neotoma lepida TaxID=56216 RepID=A0A1A6GIH7_NEOLE|nr:hypothetical protein A6R68_06342 [Neotoma lepida]
MQTEMGYSFKKHLQLLLLLRKNTKWRMMLVQREGPEDLGAQIRRLQRLLQRIPQRELYY